MEAAVARRVAAMSEQGVANTWLGLAKMGARWADLRPQTRQALLASVAAVGPTLTQEGLSHALWAAAVMGAPLALTAPAAASQQGDSSDSSDGRHAASAALALALQRLAGASLTAQSVSSILYALALAHTNGAPHCGCAYADLSPPVAAALERQCGHAAAAMSARDVSLTLYALGKLGTRLTSMPAGTRRALLAAAARHCIGPPGAVNEQNFGQLVWGLGRVEAGGGSGGALRGPLGAIVCSAVERQCARRVLTRQSLTAVLKGLHSLMLLPPGRDGDVAGGGDGDDVVWGTATDADPPAVAERLWGQLPPSLRGPLVAAAEDVLAGAGPQDAAAAAGVGPLLHWLGRLQVSYVRDVPASLRRRVATALLLTPSTDAPAAVLAVNGVAVMGGTWALLAADEQAALAKAAERAVAGADALEPSEAASLCWSLARIGFPAAQTDAGAGLGAALAALLERHVAAMTSYELAWTLWALGKLGWTWAYVVASPSAALGPRLLRALEAAMLEGADPRELGVALWAVGRLQIPVNDLSLSLRTALLAGLDSMVVALQR